MNAYIISLGLTTNSGVNLIVDSGYTRADIGTMIASILRPYGIDGFTLTWCDGYWMGSPEPAVEIYISGDLSDADAQAIGRDLCSHFQQDCVGLRRDNPITFIS